MGLELQADVRWTKLMVTTWGSACSSNTENFKMLALLVSAWLISDLKKIRGNKKYSNEHFTHRHTHTHTNTHTQKSCNDPFDYESGKNHDKAFITIVCDEWMWFNSFSVRSCTFSHPSGHLLVTDLTKQRPDEGQQTWSVTSGGTERSARVMNLSGQIAWR